MNAARLLIVDDERALLDLLRRYLERLGYQVEAVGTAEEALIRFEQEPDGYALVVADLGLPGMNGEALLERIHAMRPRQPALISSGYPYQPKSKRVGFLQKPYLPKMLVEAVERMLKG